MVYYLTMKSSHHFWRGCGHKTVRAIGSTYFSLIPGIEYDRDKIPQLLTNLSFEQIGEMLEIQEIFMIFE